jgi:hypothetical protein
MEKKSNEKKDKRIKKDEIGIVLISKQIKGQKHATHLEFYGPAMELVYILAKSMHRDPELKKVVEMALKGTEALDLNLDPKVIKNLEGALKSFADELFSKTNKPNDKITKEKK